MTVPTERPDTAGEPDPGFTLVELLVVMIVVAVLAAIAVPTLQGMRNRAYIASVKSDVMAITKAVNAEYVDGLRELTVEGSAGRWRLLEGATEVEQGALSAHNVVSANSRVGADGTFCLSVENEKVDAQFWTADDSGLRTGDCAPAGP